MSFFLLQQQQQTYTRMQSKSLTKRFANPNIFITFVVKYDESDFFPKRRIVMDRNRHIHTWCCVYKRYKSFDEESASSNMLRKICSPLHFRVVDNYNGGSNGMQL